MITLIETDSPDLIRSIHAEGFTIELAEKRQIRWLYRTTASRQEVLSLCTERDGYVVVSSIPQDGCR
jgi:hypothetical protein